MSVADGYQERSLLLPNGKRNTKFRDIAMRVLSRNWGKIGNGSGGAGNTDPEPDLTTSPYPEDEAPMTIPSLATLEPDSAQRYVIEMLDSLRRQIEQVNYNRPRYMLLARKYGLKHAEIAVLLDMSEDAVRQAIRRAKGTPGLELDE